MATNLQFIKSNTASSVTSMDITDCFTDQYDVYAIIIDNFDIGSGVDLAVRLRNASGVVSSANYDDAIQLMRSYGGGFADNNDENDTKWKSFGFYDPNSGIGQGVGIGTTIYIFNPTNTSSYTFALWQNAGVSSIGTPARKGIGVLTVAEAHTGINFLDSGGATILGISASVYGVLG